ncbi:hypothetical protein PMAC_002217 [Pneumocystis sp. 'macacae']|nr:hypothetical protein PMAC_002217 [Pneumocystis sp. 'macacae']
MESNEETDDSVISIEGLVKGREKRITAGNRLQALLDQEFKAEGIFDVGDDQDDDFDSDQHPLQDIEISESGQEEDNVSSEGHEDSEIERDEKKACLHRVPKGPRIKKLKPKTFTVVHPDSVRHSSRAHAIENKNIINRRLKEAQKRKERHSPFVRIKERPMTQEERIAEAKITEEKNKTLLQRLIKIEEEKKENIRNLLKTKRTITGPFIRFWSKGIEQRLDGKWIFFDLKDVNIEEKHMCRNRAYENDTKDTLENIICSKNSLWNTPKKSIEVLQNITENLMHDFQEKQEVLNEKNRATEIVLQEPISGMISCFHTNDKQSDASIDRKLKISKEGPFQGPSMFSARNYIILEGFSESLDTNKQKDILFSYINPPIGNIAKYKDPVSGLYYSDLSAYKIIHQIIRGEIPWSRLSGTFVDVLKPAQGVPLDFYNTTVSNFFLFKDDNIRRDINDSFYRYKMPRLQSKACLFDFIYSHLTFYRSRIARALSRSPLYVTKFFGFELGAQTTTNTDADRYIVNGAHDAEKLQDLLDIFIQRYVLCKSCKNPETDIIILKNDKIVRDCKACGQRSDVPHNAKLAGVILKNPPKNNKTKKSKVKVAASPEQISIEKEAESNDEFMPAITIPEQSLYEGYKIDDDDNDWTVDTSEAAVKARINELEGNIRANLTLYDEEDEDEQDENNPYNQFGTWILENLSASNIEIYKKAQGLKIENKHKAVAVLAQTIFDENIISQIENRASLFRKMIRNNEKHEKSLLGGTERLIDTNQTKLIPLVPKILMQYYQNDLLSEEVIIKWANKISKRYVDKEVDKKIKKAAEPFLKWLEEADDNDSESE